MLLKNPKRRPANAPKEVRPATTDDLAAEKLFTDIDRSVLEDFAPIFSICSLEINNKLHLERSGEKFLYIVRDGYLTVRSSSKLLPQRSNYFIAWRGPGRLIGEVNMLNQNPDVSELKIKATGPCELLEMPSVSFMELADAAPLIYRNLANLLIVKIITERRRNEVRQIQSMSVMSLVARTIVNLYRIRGYCPESQVLKGIVQIVDIAGYVGCGARAVSESLENLQAAGIINYSMDKTIEILDMRRLEIAR